MSMRYTEGLHIEFRIVGHCQLSATWLSSVSRSLGCGSVGTNQNPTISDATQFVKGLPHELNIEKLQLGGRKKGSSDFLSIN